jgi:hypothetical protein
LATAGSAWADGSPFVGRWHWNRTESTLPPGEPGPRDMVIDVSQADLAHLRWSVAVTDPQGQRSVETYDAPPDGTFHPISGDTTASFHLNGSTLAAVFRGPEGQTDKMTCTVSPNRQKMTCLGSMSGPNGTAIGYRDVYDRS